MQRRVLGAGVLWLVILAGVLLCGCISERGPSPPASPTPVVPALTPPPSPTPLSNQSIAEANNRFAFDLYAHLTREGVSRENNLFFSPFSISSALALTGEGARGATADEIRSVFHFPTDDNLRRQGFSALIGDLNRPDAGYTLRTANALWAERTYPFLPAYLQIARQYYGANVTNLDFVHAPEESRVTINRWVEDQTEDKIRNLIPEGVIDPLTRLVITNAIYFFGSWKEKFDPNLTQEADFRVSPGTTVRVEMMHTSGEYPFRETDRLQILELPYNHTGESGLSMLLLLPKDGDLATLERSLSPQNLSLWRGSLTPGQVDVYLPRFRMETKYDLTAPLTSLGMPTAFTPAADLSGMDGTRNLQISAVIHQAYVDVNEQGTEAAAATAVVIRLTSVAVVPEFRADHPFLFLIVEDSSGAILFMGRMVNPEG